MKTYLKTFFEKDKKLNPVDPSFENLFRFPFGLIGFPLIVAIISFHRFDITDDTELGYLSFATILILCSLYYWCFVVKTLKTMELTSRALRK